MDSSSPVKVMEWPESLTQGENSEDGGTRGPRPVKFMYVPVGRLLLPIESAL